MSQNSAENLRKSGLAGDARPGCGFRESLVCRLSGLRAARFRFGAIGWRQAWKGGVGGGVRKGDPNAQGVPRNSAKSRKNQAPPGPLPGPTPRVLHEVSSQSAGNSWSLTIPAIVRHVASRHQPSTLNYQPSCRPGPFCRQLHDWRSRRTPGPKMDRVRACSRLPQRGPLPF